jgi:hypothetical protein
MKTERKGEDNVKELIHAKSKAFYAIMVCFILIAFACSPSPGIPPTPIQGVTSTSTPKPTDTPTPTMIIAPTVTFTPSPTPTPLVADRGQVLFSESFDDEDFPFSICGKGRVESGLLVVENDPADEAHLCGMFSGGIYGTNTIPPDTTLVVLFKTTSDFNIGIHTGDYKDGSIRRFSFGITQGIGTWDLMIGKVYEGWRVHGTSADRWYYFSIKYSTNGEVDTKLWERDNPKNVTEFQGNLGAEFATNHLYFVADFKDVPFLVDEYQILK